MDAGLVANLAGVLVAGLAGVLGVWMERERKSSKLPALAFSLIIFFAMAIDAGHTVIQEAADQKVDEAMARVLDKLSDLADKGDNPMLQSFVSSELAAQARTNPGVVKRLERKLAAKGGDPSAIRRRASEGRRSAAGLPQRKHVEAGHGSKGTHASDKAEATVEKDEADKAARAAKTDDAKGAKKSGDDEKGKGRGNGKKDKKGKNKK